VLLLDEPDNFLDVPGKRWLEEQLQQTPKTVLYVSHDRELLARTANRIVTVEGGSAWVHGGGFASYHDARRERHERLDELRRRWDEERAKLKALILFYRQKAAYNSDMASRYHAAEKRLERFDADGPPEERPREQRVRMRLRGGRTGVRAVTCERLELTGLMQPFDVELFYGERVAVLGSNGSGKSYFLRLLAGSTLLLLDEPTDNLDVDSAEALEEGLLSYEGTVVAVTHDRWFARSFDRFLVFGADGVAYEAPEPVWDEGRVRRAR